MARCTACGKEKSVFEGGRGLCGNCFAATLSGSSDHISRPLAPASDVGDLRGDHWEKLNNFFGGPRLFRSYVVLQALGFAGLLYLSTTVPHWEFFPYIDSRWEIRWDVLDWRHYTRYQTNWYALVFALGPALVIKSVAWIKGGRI